MTNRNTEPDPQVNTSGSRKSVASILSKEGYAHLKEEGFSPKHCQQLVELGWRWIDAEESKKLGFGLRSPDGSVQHPSGLLMPLGEAFVQLRCDQPLPLNSHGKPVKYLSVAKQRPVLLPNSEVLKPYRSADEDGPMFVTEGAKDAMSATLRGVPLGALAGVSHARKALAKDSKVGLLFDSDGWTNHQVFMQLFHGAMHTGGKVQILPPIDGHPKAGLCEYFRAGNTAESLRELLKEAVRPTELLFQWIDRLVDHPDPVKLMRCVGAMFTLSLNYMSDTERTILLGAVRLKLGPRLSVGQVSKLWKAAQTRHDNIQKAHGKGKGQSVMARSYEQVRRHYKDKIRLNQRALEIEFNGRPLERYGKVQLDIARTLGLDLTADHTRTMVQEIGEENGYDPVSDYLERVEMENCLNPRLDTFFDDAAERYFGNSDEMAAVFLRKWAISAVARAIDPGCKVDTALFLRGGQGVGKSTFFKALCEQEEWFTDSVDNVDKDGILTAHRHWLIEWSELEVVFRKADQSFVKSFMSRTADVVRAPYGETYVRYPRRFVLVGTTNDNEFLSDPTGSRRFWVLEVKKQIPVELVRKERDLFWAAALHLLRERKEQYHLDLTQAELAQRMNQSYASTHPWDQAIVRYLRENPCKELTVNQIYDHIQPDVAHQDKRGQMVIADCLTRLGWIKGARKRSPGGDRVYPWYAPAEEIDVLTAEKPVLTDHEGIGQGVRTPQNPVPDLPLSSLSPPSQPFIEVKENQNEKTEGGSENIGLFYSGVPSGDSGQRGQNPQNPDEDSVSAVRTPSTEVGPPPAMTPPEPPVSSLDPSLAARFVVKSEWLDPENPRCLNGRSQFFRVIRAEKGKITLWKLLEKSAKHPQSVADQNVVLTPEMARRMVPKQVEAPKPTFDPQEDLL